MRVKYIRSLLWLSRWHNGRAQRLSHLHRAHLATLTELVLSELGARSYRYRVELTLYGIPVVASCTPHGVQIHSIGAPGGFSGYQRGLFPRKAERKPKRIIRFTRQQTRRLPCS